MKRHGIAVLAFVAALAAFVTPASAFVSQKISTRSAEALVGGARTADFTMAIRNTNDPFGADQSSVTWSGITPLVTNWKIADRLLVINSTVTDTGGGVKIYTDNTGIGASPAFVDPTPGAIGTVNRRNSDSSAGGLVADDGVNSQVLPMAWSIKSATRTVESGTVDTGIGAADPNTGPATATRDNKFQWLFVTDPYNWTDGVDFNNDGDVLDVGDSTPQALDSRYTTMIKHSGIHFGQADGEFAALGAGQNAYVYLEANFAQAAAQTAYKTSTLRVEAYIQ